MAHITLKRLKACLNSKYYKQLRPAETVCRNQAKSTFAIFITVINKIFWHIISDFSYETWHWRL